MSGFVYSFAVSFDLSGNIDMDRIMTTRYQSPAGEMILGSAGDKLCLCDWVVEGRVERICRRIGRSLNAGFESGSSEVINRAVGELDEYFAGKRIEFDLPLWFCGSEFQCAVWSELLNIRYGTTISYLELARRIGRPRASRAVASANASNALAVIVPCHRVIGSDNSLAGYSGGVDVKRRLLTLESRISGNSLLL